MSKWVYPVIPSVYSVLVYHGYTNATVGSSLLLILANTPIGDKYKG